MGNQSAHDLTDSQTTESDISCSSCGHNQFDRTAPKALVAFSRDYRCRRCGHCFPAATPIWASLLFLLGGLPLTLAGLFATVAGANDSNPVAQLLGMGMLFMGSTAAWHGGKTLLRSKISFEIED
jgi:ribosomal protein L37E